jgi:hypothetical protein
MASPATGGRPSMSTRSLGCWLPSILKEPTEGLIPHLFEEVLEAAEQPESPLLHAIVQVDVDENGLPSRFKLTSTRDLAYRNTFTIRFEVARRISRVSTLTASGSWAGAGGTTSDPAAMPDSISQTSSTTGREWRMRGPQFDAWVRRGGPFQDLGAPAHTKRGAS